MIDFDSHYYALCRYWPCDGVDCVLIEEQIYACLMGWA